MPVPKETTKPTNQVIVKLRDGGSCFFDQKNQIFISGKDAKTVTLTTKVAQGIRGGALIKVDDDEVKKTEDDEQKKADEAKKQEAKDALKKTLLEDKPDFAQTDYKVLQGWVATLELEPASKKKEDLEAALSKFVEDNTATE